MGQVINLMKWNQYNKRKIFKELLVQTSNDSDSKCRALLTMCLKRKRSVVEDVKDNILIVRGEYFKVHNNLKLYIPTLELEKDCVY